MKMIDRLKSEFDENPLLTIGVLTAAVAAASKFIDAVAGFRSKEAYARSTNRRTSSRR